MMAADKAWETMRIMETPTRENKPNEPDRIQSVIHRPKQYTFSMRLKR